MAGVMFFGVDDVTSDDATSDDASSDDAFEQL
jgi:hypothetical protein